MKITVIPGKTPNRYDAISGPSHFGVVNYRDGVPISSAREKLLRDQAKTKTSGQNGAKK